MKIFIKDKDINETLFLLKSGRRVLIGIHGNDSRDLSPEIFTIGEIIEQIEYEQQIKHERIGVHTT
jgi:hypothetical protein